MGMMQARLLPEPVPMVRRKLFPALAVLMRVLPSSRRPSAWAGASLVDDTRGVWRSVAADWLVPTGVRHLRPAVLRFDQFVNGTAGRERRVELNQGVRPQDTPLQAVINISLDAFI